jgi:two-component system chemotaxis response regulator CheY
VDIKKARILVVEDESVMSTFIMNSLFRIGIRDVHPFKDGSGALRDVTRLRPDLILTDVHMQPVGGIEFVKQLRALPDAHVSKTKVIFLSADSSPSTVGEALPLGVAGYLVKPPALAALTAKIEAALRT